MVPWFQVEFAVFADIFHQCGRLVLCIVLEYFIICTNGFRIGESCKLLHIPACNSFDNLFE